MVVVGGRVSIPGEEPIPVTCDQMSKSVEILWWKPPPQQQQPTGKVQMLNSVMELYNNTHLSDMTLIVEDRQIPAHRHVLATHSSMFDRMWNYSMKEVRAVLTKEKEKKRLPLLSRALMVSHVQRRCFAGRSMSQQSRSSYLCCAQQQY